MIAALYSFAYMFIGYVLIFSGLAFSNKLFFPSLLDSIYQSTSFGLRTVIFTVIFALPANFITAKAFGIVSPSIAGPMLLAAVVLIIVINAMILDKVHLTLPIIGAASGALFFCCLTAWLLEAQRLSQ